jgi:hypothetical protein
VSSQSNEIWPETSSQDIVGFLKIGLITKVCYCFSLMKQTHNKTKQNHSYFWICYRSSSLGGFIALILHTLLMCIFPDLLSDFPLILTLTCYSQHFKSWFSKHIRLVQPINGNIAVYSSDMTFLRNIIALRWEIYKDSITRISKTRNHTGIPHFFVAS